MELECKNMEYLCELETFKINGKRANWEEFGEKYDDSPETADDYCCGYMKFFPYNNPESEILKKYNINTDEYYEICRRLEKELSFGPCHWCS